MEQSNIGLEMVHAGVMTTLYQATQEGNAKGLTFSQLVERENAVLPDIFINPTASLKPFNLEQAVKLAIDKGVRDGKICASDVSGQAHYTLTPNGEHIYTMSIVNREVSEILNV